MAALTALFLEVAKDVKTMETHLKKAIAVKDRLTRIQRSNDYMDDATVREIEKTLTSSKSNNIYLVEKLDKYKDLKVKLDKQLSDPSLMTESSLKVLQIKVDKAKQVLQTIQNCGSNSITTEKGFNAQLNMKEGASSELECVICLELPPKQVFSCTEQHILCSNCNSRVEKCPICRQNFKATPTTRNRLAEKIILRLK